MKLKKSIVFLLMMALIATTSPLGVFAENQPILNQTASQSMVVQSLDEVSTINENSNIDQEIIVIYKDHQASIGNLSLTTSEIKSGATLSPRVDVIEVNDGIDADSMITELQTNPNVLVAEKNSYLQTTALPDDPDLTTAWQFGRIGTDVTWNQITNSEPIVVAVIDTGLNIQHPDLIGKTVAGYDYVDDTLDIKDIAGHGTKVSGVIAATANNSIGIAGIAGTANVKIAPYRVGGTFEGDTNLSKASICAALYDAASRSDVKVINMSFGWYDASPALETAITNATSAGKVLVSSSGNEGKADNINAGQYSYPASYNGVISVGATTSADTIASYSQYNDQVDLTAPGNAVYTTTSDGSYKAVSGTSFASPVVAGACAVLMAADPSLTSAKVETILKSTAQDFGDAGKDSYYGYGLIKLDDALAALPNTPSITYQTHVQDVGWQGWKTDGELSGTAGQALRLEGIEINVDKKAADLGVKYKTQVENIGWQDYVADGTMSGTYGQSLRLEAIQIELTGADAQLFDVYYQVHAENLGWLGWAKNGDSAGTEGLAYRLEAIRIEIVPKGMKAPGSTATAFVSN
ncbi:S8 family serine peptidase [Acetobacterium fimetarium]|uniref:S8 family serine peptidase n=1 Tax=Acetobacterium fimetarium TaxID=52691 RepID=A0ABR6WXF7_9FIRM|nr:S8 family serine peptidase [Acetobacterium fimetarium]MBC3805060.1 S8 family serine peptidase [Acetobacterium fimetarium]